MKKISTIAVAIAIMLLPFLSAFVLAEASLDGAAPKAEEQRQEQPSDEASAISQPTSGNISISKRNKAKVELEQQKKLRQEQIDKEKAAEPVQQ